MKNLFSRFRSFLFLGFFVLIFPFQVSHADFLDNMFPELKSLKLGDMNSECMLDLMNDRFGINAGSVVGLVGDGIEGLGDLLGLGGDALGGVGGKVMSGIEAAGGGIVGGAVGGVVGGSLKGAGAGTSVLGKGLGYLGKGVGAVGGVLGRMDMNDLSLMGLIDALDPSAKPVFSGPGIKRGARIVRCNIDKGISTGESLFELTFGWLRFSLQLVAMIAVVALIYAGYLYITSLGGAGVDKAKKILLYVAMGLILILGSYAIVNTIMQARFGVIV